MITPRCSHSSHPLTHTFQATSPPHKTKDTRTVRPGNTRHSPALPLNHSHIHEYQNSTSALHHQLQDFNSQLADLDLSDPTNRNPLLDQAADALIELLHSHHQHALQIWPTRPHHPVASDPAVPRANGRVATQRTHTHQMRKTELRQLKRTAVLRNNSRTHLRNLQHRYSNNNTASTAHNDNNITGNPPQDEYDGTSLLAEARTILRLDDSSPVQLSDIPELCRTEIARIIRQARHRLVQRLESKENAKYDENKLKLKFHD